MPSLCHNGQMAQLFPADFDVQQLEPSEQRVVTAFVDLCDDSWIVVPKIPITVEKQDAEIDIALVSFDHGMVLVEVKGGRIGVDAGQWTSHGRKIKNPVEQSMKSKHALLKRLGHLRIDLRGVFITHAVAFPDIVDFPAEGVGLDCPRDIVFTGTDLERADVALAHMARDVGPIPVDNLRALLRALRPDVTDTQVDGRYVRGTSQRINKLSHDRLGPVIGLDENTRIFVRGAAGTGKTFIASRWAARALRRGERTLFVCYNKFLGEEIARRMNAPTDEQENLPATRTGSFHAVANAILGTHAPAVPQPASQEFWDNAHARALMDNRAYIRERYDTIIIDEAQDFRPLWFEALQGFLEDPDEGRFYVMADEKQVIYGDSWQPPRGFTTLTLTKNVRNTQRITSMVRHFGGAEAMETSPAGPEVMFTRVGAMKEARKAIGRSIAAAVGQMGIPRSQILVLVPHRSDRDKLIADPIEGVGFARWTDRDEDSILCETIQSTKGLERSAVILVNLDEDPDATLTYIGASRAVAFLSVVGTQALIDQFSPTRGTDKG
jgi:hypothetical protein